MMEISGYLTTAVAFVVALGVLVFVHELGHFLVAKRLGVKVLRFSIGFGPLVWARRRGETEYALSAIPLGGYVKMLGETDDEMEGEPERAFSTQRPWRRAAIVVAGPAMNFAFAFLVYVLLFLVVGGERPSMDPRVGGVSLGSPASRGGLEVGDRITRVGETDVTTWEAMAMSVRASGGKPIVLRVTRGEQSLDVTVTPERRQTRDVFGEDTGEQWIMGIEASREWVRVGPVDAVVMAGQHTVTASYMVAKGLALMLQGRVPLRELGGPIAIARAAGEQARAGTRYFLSMLAFLSINLGVLNLLPVPALDGGQLALVSVEGVLRRPLRPRVREIAQQVGFLMLVTLMLFVVSNDILRLVQG